MFDTSGSCKLGDFESFFKKLFSHEDRPNDSEQERVKSDVNNYFESIRDKNSTKFLLNEVVHFYTSGISTIHVVSLGASKAFDKMWRSGLFYKLKSKVEPVIWRSLFMYYGMSEIIIKINGEKSKPVKITEGVKQEGVLSPYMFNFYIKDLILECLDLNLGAKIGKTNLS
ncbi:unnamed protein product, partial [Brachionus calyciflorus]